MSDRTNKDRVPLWWVYPVDGSKSPALFSGDREAMVSHINALHLETGVQHASREVE